jgi:hypothetical protein
MASGHAGAWLIASGHEGACRSPCSAYEIERRPRGARGSPLPHLFRASLPVPLPGPPCWYDAVSAWALPPLRMTQGMHQGRRGTSTGIIGPKQMWERACPRCAARAALDLKALQGAPGGPDPSFDMHLVAITRSRSATPQRRTTFPNLKPNTSVRQCLGPILRACRKVPDMPGQSSGITSSGRRFW